MIHSRRSAAPKSFRIFSIKTWSFISCLLPVLASTTVHEARAAKGSTKPQFVIQGYQTQTKTARIRCPGSCPFFQSEEIEVTWKAQGVKQGFRGFVKDTSAHGDEISVKILGKLPHTGRFAAQGTPVRVAYNSELPALRDTFLDEKDLEKQKEEVERKQRKREEAPENPERLYIAETGWDIALGVGMTDMPQTYVGEFNIHFAPINPPLYLEIGIIPSYTSSPSRVLIPYGRIALRWDFDFWTWRIGAFGGIRARYFQSAFVNGTSYYTTDFKIDWDAGGILGIGPPDFYYLIRASRRSLTAGISLDF